MRAVFPGSFDPVTLGHVDIVRRASALFDEVIVAVGSNAAKAPLFDLDQRLALLRAATEDIDRVVVEPFEGLLVDYCTARQASVVVKGIRGPGDAEYELQMAQLNAQLTGLETVWLPTSPQWAYVSSSRVREIALLGGDVSGFVPAGVAGVIAAAAAKRRSGDV